jgi:hypothetical protein
MTGEQPTAASIQSDLTTVDRSHLEAFIRMREMRRDVLGRLGRSAFESYHFLLVVKVTERNCQRGGKEHDRDRGQHDDRRENSPSHGFSNR